MSSNSEDMDQVKTERRRLRMRLAQRKHRARQEQKVQDLENENQALQRRVEDFETQFGDLEGKLLKACTNDPKISAEIRRAIGLFRQSSHLEVSPHTTSSLLPAAAPVLDPTIAAFSDHALDMFREELPIFSLRLYEYCTRLACRILSSRDGPSIRLARKIFQYRLKVDAKNGEEYNLLYLRDCLAMRASKLDHKDTASKSCQRALNLPRWPGFSSFLDVVGVERYLVGRGFTFTEDAVELSMDGLSISNQISELETDIFGGADSTSVPLPFGLVDVGATEIQDGLLSPRSLGSPNLDNDWMQFDSMAPKHPQIEATPNRVFNQGSLRISFTDLIERLALTAICMGGPGPGFTAKEVDSIVESLSEQAWRSLL